MVWHQAIIWTNADILPNLYFETNFGEIFMVITDKITTVEESFMIQVLLHIEAVMKWSSFLDAKFQFILFYVHELYFSFQFKLHLKRH